LIALALKMEGPSFMKIGGVSCAILGAAISVAGSKVLQMLFGSGPDQAVPESQNSDFPGGLLLLVNAMFYSALVTVQKIALNTVKPLTVSAWSIFITAILTTFIALFFVDTINLGAVTLEGWLALTYVTVVSTGVVYVLILGRKADFYHRICCIHYFSTYPLSDSGLFLFRRTSYCDSSSRNGSDTFGSFPRNPRTLRGRKTQQTGSSTTCHC